MACRPCAVHVIRDHGFSGTPRRYWLVSGVNVKQPGAYVSWSSANAQYMGVPGAACKTYDASQWNELESAWHASCLRGEHGDHEWLDESVPVAPGPALQTPTLATRASPAASSRLSHTPQWARTPATRIVTIDSRTPSPTPSPSNISSSPSPTTASHSITPARQWVYAVRARGSGQIFDMFGPAPARNSPNLSISRSLTAAVGFVQEQLSVSAAEDTPENRERWIREEILAHVVHDGSDS
ncbi:hypothetical protein GGX14DRAFT_556102 [Mycena pura]|uniref:Uncharacterized protein n=1 Tax=Mycena pura TaxID=153505 RepID=A0AAD7E2L0_9AGAR|nr:hypothetical protein GGX14DRAFT_556102 [Mycena pura]